ncbi:hypothetical protein [Parafrankia discariae]|uniref:hypothetical protein n=1 Tax=Parafrankia discariae TaxID=365528 RepID=UPI000399B64C|nr:hypothetical protein [Parafrankia discariae]
MDPLLESVLEAHGGRQRWAEISTLTARLAVGGPFWGIRGFPDAFLDETLTIAIATRNAALTPWTAPDHTLVADLTHDRVTLRGADGSLVEKRDTPRPSYAGYDLYSPWDRLQVGYFLGYAMWNYLTTPHLLTHPGMVSREIQPWDENGQHWRRLQVTFPATVPTHTAEQVFYFDADGLLRRLDYTVDVNANATVAHYTDGHRTFEGLVFPTRRRVYPRRPDRTRIGPFPARTAAPSPSTSTTSPSSESASDGRLPAGAIATIGPAGEHKVPAEVRPRDGKRTWTT